jgi:hypothetical protein
MRPTPAGNTSMPPRLTLWTRRVNTLKHARRASGGLIINGSDTDDTGLGPPHL